MRIPRPQFNVKIIDNAGFVVRYWADFFIGIWHAIGDVGRTITVEATLDFPSVAAGTTEALTVTVTGARANDEVTLGPPASLDDNLVYDAHITTDDTVTVRAINNTAGAIDPASSTWRVTVRTY